LEKLTWAKAQLTCQDDGGHLAEPKDIQKFYEYMSDKIEGWHPFGLVPQKISMATGNGSLQVNMLIISCGLNHIAEHSTALIAVLMYYQDIINLASMVDCVITPTTMCVK
ncbi:unnamed protein product, partial [Meganyctiphanes norvegica]